MNPKKPKTFRMFAVHSGGAFRFRRRSSILGTNMTVGPLVFAARGDAEEARRPGEEVVEILCVPQFKDGIPRMRNFKPDWPAMNGEPRFVARAANVIVQERSARRKVAELERYAAEIGCRVEGDSVAATPEQSKLLDAKWEELNR